MNSLEIEIKSLLGDAERAEELRMKLRSCTPPARFISRNKQRNHYFIGGDVQTLSEKLRPHLSVEDYKKLESVIATGRDFSIRTRLIDGKTLLFVIKASRDEGSSHNTVSRLEFEVVIPNVTIDELDALLLSCGFQYQAKWSREREEYRCGDIHVCLDKNAGYGYLVEFEKMVSSEEEMEAARSELTSFMETLGVQELPQDRLERMFAHYNKHWLDYYGTEKIFVVD